MENLIADILSSTLNSLESISNLSEKVAFKPNDFLKTIATGDDSITLDQYQISLLSLKNEALLSYLQNVILVVLSKVETLKVGIKKSSSDEEGNEKEQELIDKIRNDAVIGTIKQRAVLEKGVKGLEKKISYQIDKSVRTYLKGQKDYEDGLAIHDEKNIDDDDDDDSDVNSEEDEMNSKPNAQAIKPSEGERFSRSEDGSSTAKYKPPKISAVTPFSEKSTSQRRRKNNTMDEFLAEETELPQSQVSIGSTILSNGRYGTKTDRDRQKEAEIQRYEEDNFTRLPEPSKKKNNAILKKRQQNSFGGEDWSMLDSKRDGIAEATRRKKSGSLYERSKKKRRQE